MDRIDLYETTGLDLINKNVLIMLSINPYCNVVLMKVNCLASILLSCAKSLAIEGHYPPDPQRTVVERVPEGCLPDNKFLGISYGLQFEASGNSISWMQRVH